MSCFPLFSACRGRDELMLCSDFYGGWITSNIKGKMKGGEWSLLPGNRSGG